MAVPPLETNPAQMEARNFRDDISYTAPHWAYRGSPLPEQVNQSFASYFQLYTCLALVQELRVDFLPVTHQTHLREVGRGGTSIIQQSLLNPRYMLAFKRPNTYEQFLTELAICGCPPIRGHPFIADLEGVSWDVSEDGCFCQLVLVFEKSPLGDFTHYMTTAPGNILSLEERLPFCVQIAKALSKFHSHCRSMQI